MQLNQGMHINFVGRRLKTKDDVKLRLFEAEIPVKIINLCRYSVDNCVLANAHNSSNFLSFINNQFIEALIRLTTWLSSSG